jgi:hypothetical protein
MLRLADCALVQLADRITLYEGQDVRVAASQFATKHRLTAEMESKLVSLLAQQLQQLRARGV